MMIDTQRQADMRFWLCERIGLVPTPQLVCIGSHGTHGRAVIGFDGFNDASALIHVAGEGRWMSRLLLKLVFEYAFVTAKLKVLVGLVPSGNESALRLNKHLGFKIVANIPDAHPDGSLIVMAMHKDECRWVVEKSDGKEEQADAAASA